MPNITFLYVNFYPLAVIVSKFSYSLAQWARAQVRPMPAKSNKATKDLPGQAKFESYLSKGGGGVASWLVPSSPDRAVWVRALARDIVLCYWARHLTLTVPLSAQVYKWVLVN